MKTNPISAGYAPQLLLSQFSEVEHRSWNLQIHPFGRVVMAEYINGITDEIYEPFDLSKQESAWVEKDGYRWLQGIPVREVSMTDVLTRFWDYIHIGGDIDDLLENEPLITFYHYDGSVYQWDFTLAHYCFAKGRLSEEDLVESLRVVPAGKEA